MSENNYSLKFTPKAYDDLDEIYSYISEKLFDEQAADNLMDRIEHNILRLKSFPYSCSFVTEETLKAKGYRKLIINNYIAFYMVNEVEHQVIIMRVLYGAQNYEGIL